VNLAAAPPPLDNRRVESEQAPPPRDAPGAHEAEFARYVTLFSLVFVVGFALIAVVLATRRRGSKRVDDDSRSA
jgi:hypothetical protein